MRIYGIGTDILRVNRIRLLMEKRGPLRVAMKFLSESELHTFNQLHAPKIEQTWREDKRYLWLGVRFSVKEAIYKAAYPRCKFTWKDLSIVKVRSKPTVRIENPELSKKIGKIHISISHDGDYVSTYAIVEEPERPPAKKDDHLPTKDPPDSHEDSNIQEREASTEEER